jgi:hypothetical protein
LKKEESIQMTRKIIFTFLAFTLALGILAFYQTNVTYAAGVYPAPTTKHVTSMTPLNATTCLNSPSKANCDNQDPYNNTGVQTNGCGVDAKVIAFKNFSTGYVEIMWSQNCQSNWTVLGVYGGTAPLVGQTTIE